MFFKPNLMERIKKILANYGLKNQLKKTVEECNELIAECRTYDESEEAKIRMRSEIADVFVMCLQLMIGIGITDKELIGEMYFKTGRQLARMKVEEARKRRKEVRETHDAVNFGEWLELENSEDEQS